MFLTEFFQIDVLAILHPASRNSLQQTGQTLSVQPTLYQSIVATLMVPPVVRMPESIVATGAPIFSSTPDRIVLATINR
jgi:hypothetical protein